jgi:uncharacterized protein
MPDFQFSAAALDLKERALHARIVSLPGLLVAYSGGTDSAFLAWTAHEVLGDNTLALLADSPSLPRRELKLAIEFAERWGIPLSVIATQEMSIPEYTRNDGSRCFHCKSELFTVMERERHSRDFKHIAYGKNLDDQSDFRPGDRAAKEHRVVAPLADVGLTKQEIRLLAQRYGLEVWDKPASACLSSRLEYGRPVTREALAVVEAGEEALRERGFRQARVRHHGEIVRIEIGWDELDRTFRSQMGLSLYRFSRSWGSST